VPRRGVVTTPRVLFAQRTGLLYLKVFMPEFAEDSLRVGCVLDAARSNPAWIRPAGSCVHLLQGHARSVYIPASTPFFLAATIPSQPPPLQHAASSDLLHPPAAGQAQRAARWAHHHHAALLSPAQPRVTAHVASLCCGTR
jgi:hypothetical protein